MFRKQIDKDIFASDNAGLFSSTKINLGNAVPKTTGKVKKPTRTIKEDPYYDPNLPTDKKGRKIDYARLFEDDIQKQLYHAFIGESKSIGKK